jgi:DNA-directed RNA polymerase subunit H (RpoH/RPB5)
MGQQERSKNNNNNNNNNNNSNEPAILEQGDIYFFYRPKKDAQEVKGIEDVRRFFMVTGPENKQFYRLFVIGKKSLPEIRKSDARASERYWARVGGIFQDQKELTKEIFSDEFRKGDVARPAGLGKYVIVRHQNHAELAYILETPGEPGEAQKELGIEKEASYIISVINPRKPAASSVPDGGKYPSAEELPAYPEEVLKEFNNLDIFVSLSRDTRLIDYQNAQVILVGAREGKDAIKRDLGIDIEEEESSNIFDKLKVRKEEIPIKPLTEGKLE